MVVRIGLESLFIVIVYHYRVTMPSGGPPHPRLKTGVCGGPLIKTGAALLKKRQPLALADGLCAQLD